MTTRSAGRRYHENVHGVYFDDLDAYQVLHNARYVLLIERTIGSFWGRLGWGSTIEMGKNPDQSHFVRANHIEYVKPVEGVGEVRVRVWVDKLGTTSLTFGFCVMPMDQDVDYAVGTRVLVRVDRDTRRPTPWSEGLRAQLGPWLAPAAP